MTSFNLNFLLNHISKCDHIESQGFSIQMMLVPNSVLRSSGPRSVVYHNSHQDLTCLYPPDRFICLNVNWHRIWLMCLSRPYLHTGNWGSNCMMSPNTYRLGPAPPGGHNGYYRRTQFFWGYLLTFGKNYTS